MNAGKPLWSGRFGERPDVALLKLTSSIEVDIALLPYDLAATKAHARALEKAGLLETGELFAVTEACDAIQSDWDSAEVTITEGDEDVHSLVERMLTERLGDTGRRIHAGRSRNDLVATDLRLWSLDATEALTERLGTLLNTIADLAEQHVTTVMPGYTHLQRAQPISLGFHLCAHGFALARDLGRISMARSAADVSPLGAGALAGTTLPIDPAVATAELGFSSQFDNAMDAVSDRDFLCDLAYAAAMCCVHLSRLGEEIVMWTSSEFGFARLSDAWSTGSSMMPQKRNPDIAELVRGRAAPAIGELTSLLTLLKGLPLAYDRDLQEDKPLIFGTVERTMGCLEGMTSLLRNVTFDAAKLAGAAATGGAWATDAAERLVERGMPFRQAHERVGALVAHLEKSGRSFTDLAGEELTGHDDAFQAADVDLADTGRSIAARDQRGGTAPSRVLEQVAELRRVARPSS